MLPTNKKFLVFCVLVFICAFILLFESYVPFESPLKFGTSQDEGFVIKTDGCKIPYMDPFDVHVLQYIENVTKPICNGGLPPLFASNLTSVYLLSDSLPHYNVTNKDLLKCCYYSFWRAEPKKNVKDENVVVSDTCKPVKESADVADEFIKLECMYEKHRVYLDTFSFVPLKNISASKSEDKLSVLVVGFDAVSRINLHRQLPKTVEYLKNNSMVELLGYNKVGDNTFPNLMPVLTGHFEEELAKTCWLNTDYRFDNCTFLWNMYKEKGYVTAYGEDASWMGLFNYGRKGFQKQATDYGYSYFSKFSEKLIGNQELGNAAICEGSRYVYKDLLDYITKFVVRMESNELPYFSFFWGASLSHDFLNFPQIGDDDYKNFFENLIENKLLKNTVLVFMSDHGIRWGGIRETYQGRMEERLPFVFILTPKSFQTTYPLAYQNLLTNTRRLTTPFDLHETLHHILDMPDKFDDTNLIYTDVTKRGISLFRQISPERTCENAGITSHWCTCKTSMEVGVNDKVTNAAHYIVHHINTRLSNYTECVKLNLEEVTSARVGWRHSGGEVLFEYILTIKTIPGNATFEATVKSDNKESFELTGSVSRLNQYGEQSACVDDFHIKLYCYCKNYKPSPG